VGNEAKRSAWKRGGGRQTRRVRDERIERERGRASRSRYADVMISGASVTIV